MIKRSIIFLGVMAFITGIFCGYATGVSRKNREINPVRINYSKSSCEEYEDTIKCNLHLYSVYEQDKSFYIRLKSKDNIDKNDLKIIDDSREKVFKLESRKSKTIDLTFNTTSVQETSKDLLNSIKIVYLN